MVEQTIQAVREAELEAQQIIRQAKSDAKTILDKANEDGVMVVHKAQSDAQAKARVEIDAAKLAAERIMNDTALEAGAQIGELAERARKNQNKAIDAVLNRLV